jgi:hypothetical protein
VISEAKFFAIKFSGNPRLYRNCRLRLAQSHAAFSHMRKGLPQRAELVELRELYLSPDNFAAPNMSRITSAGNRYCDQEASKRKGPANRAFDELLFLSVRSSARSAHLPSLAI